MKLDPSFSLGEADGLAAGEWGDEFQTRVRRRKTDDFHVFQTGLAAGGEYVVFRDVFLALGIDDPKGSRTLHGFRDFGETTKVALRIRGEKDPFGVRRGFAGVHGLGEFAQFIEKFPVEVTEQRNFRSRLHTELFDARPGMKDLVAPFFGRRTELKDRKSFRRLQAELAIHGFRRLDRGKGNLQPEIAAKKNFARLQKRLPL